MNKIVIVGVGALGSHVVQFLRNADADIKVADDDRVEMKNTLAQFHSKPSVGRMKAVALQQVVQFLFGRKIEAVPHRLIADNADALLGGADLVVDCLDNGVSRRIVQDFARARSIACLHGALAADGAYGRSAWDESFKVDDEAGAGAATCEGGEHLPFIAVVAAYIARSAQEFLASGKKVGYEINPRGAVST